MSNRFCTNCGSQLGEGTSFCTSCGAPAAAPLAADHGAEQPPEMAQPSPQVLPEQPAPTPAQAVPLGLRGRGAGPAHQQHADSEPQPPRAKSRPWGLIIGGAFAFCVLTGGVLALIVPSAGSRPTSRSALPSAPAPRPMTMPNNAFYFFGTWGPNCPSSAAEAITFFSDGTFQASGGFGTWTIDSGSTITMTGNGRTVSSRWVFSSGRAAVAYGMGTAGGQPVRRCD